MILCVGEILADMIGTEKDGSFYYERKAGGAPFNVACAAAKFGADTAFIGSVGDDLIGDFLIGFAKTTARRKRTFKERPITIRRSLLWNFPETAKEISVFIAKTRRIIACPKFPPTYGKKRI